MSIPPSPPDGASSYPWENIYQRVHAARIREGIPDWTYADDSLEPERRAEHQAYLDSSEDRLSNPLLGGNYP